MLVYQRVNCPEQKQSIELFAVFDDEGYKA